jgi:photosystem II stability/assembly factor-like uncharacterized protein
MNAELATFALLVFATVCAICVVTGGIAFAIAFRKHPTQATLAIKAFFEGGNALRVATVFGVLGTTTVLLFADKLTEGALALMSGIVGYVLGGLNHGSSEKTGPRDSASNNEVGH